MKGIVTLNTIIFITLTVLYFYQLIYILVALYHERHTKKEEYTPSKLHRFAFIIAARNESSVIANLIKSIQLQDYPAELIDIYVVADNCTDNTAAIVRENGAICYERFDKVNVGKGYALDFAFNTIREEKGSYTYYDGYFIFDADNVICTDYVTQMNKTFDQGYRIVTSYRNSKNFDTNWITSGYSLWFCREAKYLNNPRMLLKTSCAVSGTGFLVNSSIIQKHSGWKCNLLTEDIQFSVVNIIDGEKIGYSQDAMFYDEQPETFKQSWNQRLRWSKGFYQVMFRYGHKLLANALRSHEMFTSCYDMFMTIAPATILSIGGVIINITYLFMAVNNPILFGKMLPIATTSVVFAIGSFSILMFSIALITLITEWDKILASPAKKIKSIFTFPFFMLTYIPISIVALFTKVEWKPITHSVTKTIEDLSRSH